MGQNGRAGRHTILLGQLSGCCTFGPMANELPDFLVMGGWQGADPDHPVGTGMPAYRVVYKTLKVYLPASKLEWPNLLIRTGHGRVDRGGVKLGQAVQLRRKHQWLIPEFGEFAIRDETLKFTPHSTSNFAFRAWQEDVAGVVFVEFILQTTEGDPRGRMGEGRRRLGYLKTLIELSLGPRILGAVLTEELGEVFADGHFNRSLQSDQVGTEWQMGLAAVTDAELLDWTRHPLQTLTERTSADRERLSLACDWYWRSTEADDAVTEYLELWFVVEVIAMPDTTKVRPVRLRLATAYGGDESQWGDLVGRHLGRRSKLVHGEGRRQVSESHLAELRDLVQALLELDFGLSNPLRAERLRKLAGIVDA
jgi:hypothetical protein